MSDARYAIYFAPAHDSAWWRFGAHWLGRDEISDAPLPQPTLHGVGASEFQALTVQPRRYGFHATLKAPFRLQDATESTLIDALAALARDLRPVAMGLLVPTYMDGFVALVPAQPNPALHAVAARCVTELDVLRAPISAEEYARRAPERLDAVGRDMLQHYGYPHVLERFRFHLTLSGPVDPTVAGQLVANVAPGIAALNASHPPVLDRLCIFREDAPGAAFRRIHDVVLGP